MPTPEQQAAYTQSLLGLEVEATPEITLEEVTVARRPIYIALPDGEHEWRCSFVGLPDLFHPERNDVIEATTVQFATLARELSLRKGEIVTITGTPMHQEALSYGGGRTQTIYHLTVTNLVVPSRPKEKASLHKDTGVSLEEGNSVTLADFTLPNS